MEVLASVGSLETRQAAEMALWTGTRVLNSRRTNLNIPNYVIFYRKINTSMARERTAEKILKIKKIYLPDWRRSGGKSGRPTEAEIRRNETI